MISPKDIAGAVSAALVLCWGVWTELRLRQAQNSIIADKLIIKDDEIEKANSILSNTDLASELSKELSGGDTPKPKA